MDIKVLTLYTGTTSRRQRFRPAVYRPSAVDGQLRGEVEGGSTGRAQASLCLVSYDRSLRLVLSSWTPSGVLRHDSKR